MFSEPSPVLTWCGAWATSVTDYFEKELGVHIVEEPWKIIELKGKTIFLGHGDTLGSHDAKSKLIFHVFRNKTCIALLRALPPRWVFAFANRWSAHSRRRHPDGGPEVTRETDIYRFADLPEDPVLQS